MVYAFNDYIAKAVVDTIQSITKYMYISFENALDEWNEIKQLGVEPEKLVKVISIMYRIIRESGLELGKLEISLEQDIENPSWRYIVIRAHVEGDFNTIDRVWNRVSYEAYRIMGESTKNLFIFFE